MIVDTSSRKEVGQFLRMLREAKGETVGQVAIRTGYKKNTIYNYELGYATPSLPVFVGLIRHYGKRITVEDIDGKTEKCIF